MIREDEPTIQGDEFLYKLIKQSKRRIVITTVFSYNSPYPPLMEGLLHYIVPFESSWSYTCQSSMPILECMSHLPLLLMFCELW